MRGRIREISGHDSQALSDHWELASCPPGAVTSPDGVALDGLSWTPATVPCTVASCLRAASTWSLDAEPRRFDSEDWWFRSRFPAGRDELSDGVWLCCDGLATIADVWLNGTHLFQSASMFTAHEWRIDGMLRANNEIVLRFHSLDAQLAARRPRPRWRAPMVEHQQLRWFRTTLLGRTPGWSPPAAPVGPWRDIRIERRRGADVSNVHIQADAHGKLAVSCEVVGVSDSTVTNVDVVLTRGDFRFRGALQPGTSADSYTGQWSVPDVATWWPCTHGEPALYAASLLVSHSAGECTVQLGAVGFRDISVDINDGDFAISVNDVPVFARGACWTPVDPVSLSADPIELDHAFDQIVDAGMNMVRVGGTMVYESDAFLDRCDQRGVLLWQDFMFANMDYPEGDTAFTGIVRDEATQQLQRLQGRPSVAVLCGNSEGEQQAAMWGATRDRWAPSLFHVQLADLSRSLCPDVCYWPSSAHGGALPHQANAGTTSYYGVGAYLRPLDDARRADVRFASECLAFANIPDDRTLALLPNALTERTLRAAWKARTPRDLGATWDFDDVRDHYLASLFRVDPVELCNVDFPRYVSLGRVVTGEVMAAVMAEWRRKPSRTGGGLVWFLRDLWPGAGWGLIDSTGEPKAAWHFARRAMAPLTAHVTDEGGNGLTIHVINDGAVPFRGVVDVRTYRDGETVTGRAERTIDLAAHDALEVPAAAMFDWFVDLNHAYRFGPPSHDLVHVALRDEAGAVRARACHFVGGYPSAREKDVGLNARLGTGARGELELTVETRRFAQAVHVDVAQMQCDDNYFHMAPGEVRRLRLRPRRMNIARDTAPGPIVIRALNADQELTVELGVAGVA